MCGICGFVSHDSEATLSHMTDILEHRGPDDAGIFLSEAMVDGLRAGLGSRRLAIQDLSAAGHMPMGNPEGTLWIAYNGEVYNYPALRKELEEKGYSFRSHGDTEVILYLYQEYGPECVHRLNGMFAIAIWDISGQELFLARDHFGVKPLYYLQQNGRFAFASEIKALLQLPDFRVEIDSQALNQYLTFLWVPDPNTMFHGIQKLLAGHYAILRAGRLEVTRYWDMSFPPASAQYNCSEGELIEELQARFRASVQGQMISDVPIGAFLSAGLDSSSIVAMMAQATLERVRTFTITFPDKYRVGEMTLDDPAVASRVARKFGCDHYEIVVEPDVTELLPRLIWHMDEPVADPAIITAYLVSHEARRTVTVLLSGIGGDELFAGYRKHYGHYWSQAYQKLPEPLRRHMIEPLVAGLPSYRGTPLKGLVRLTQKMIRSASLDPQTAFLMHSTYLTESQKQSLYTPAARANVDGLNPWQIHLDYFDRVKDADFLNQMLYLDLKAFMVSLNLTYNDKMSMASSVEVRVPFLNWELAEFVARHVPPHLKIDGFLRPTTKYIFRKAMQGILPPEVLRQPKAGFGAPVDFWLAHDLREMVDDLLGESRVRARGYFEPRAVRQLVDEQRSGRRDWSLQIWQLLTFELWCQTFVDRTPSQALS